MRRMVQGRAGVSLAFVLGLVIATAATAGAASLITGKQIKNGTITKADLSKALRAQLAKAGRQGPTGTPGLQGPAGPQGAPGPAGPTDAAIGQYPSAGHRDPPTTPDEMPSGSGIAPTITTVRQGRIMLTAYPANGVAFGIDCTGGDGFVGMYLDGVPVAASATKVPAAASAKATALFGLTGVVPAGTHIFSLGYDCPDGTVNSLLYAAPMVSAIVIGS